MKEVQLFWGLLKKLPGFTKLEYNPETFIKEEIMKILERIKIH